METPVQEEKGFENYDLSANNLNIQKRGRSRRRQ